MNYDPNTGQPIYNNQQPIQPQQQSSTNGFAIAGLIVSIFVSAIVGLILSIIGLNKSKTTNSGKGLAIAGIIISVLKILLAIGLFLLLGGLFVGIFDAAIHQEEYCAKATECGTPNSSGYADCKYKTEDGWDITISCPVSKTKKTTEPTTTTRSNNTTGAKVFKLSTEAGSPYYADVLYLENNKLYGHITDNFPRKVATDATVNGENVNLLVTNVKSVFTAEFGQGGFEDVIFVDLAGTTYRLNNIKDDERTTVSALSFDKIEGAKDIKEVYSLSAFDARDYVLVNSKNQMINPDKTYTYAYYDKKHNLGETLIGTDVIKLTYVKSEADKTETGYSHNYYEVSINGVKQANQIDYYINENVDGFNDIELIQFPIKKSGSTYLFE